jgi:hypothetical protein
MKTIEQVREFILKEMKASIRKVEIEFTVNDSIRNDAIVTLCNKTLDFIDSEEK